MSQYSYSGRCEAVLGPFLALYMFRVPQDNMANALPKKYTIFTTAWLVIFTHVNRSDSCTLHLAAAALSLV